MSTNMKSYLCQEKKKKSKWYISCTFSSILTFTSFKSKTGMHNIWLYEKII